MHMDYLTLKLPTPYKHEIIGTVESLTPQELEMVLRIGLYGYKVVTNECVLHTSESDLVEKYEKRLIDMEQEKKTFEQVLLQYQETYANQKCKMYQDEVAKQTKTMEEMQKTYRDEWKTSQEEIARRDHEIRQLREQLTGQEAAVAAQVDQLKTSMEWKNERDTHEKVQQLQAELNATKTKMGEWLLENESSKVKALISTVEMQQKQVDELMTKKHSSVGLGQEGESYYRDLVEETFASYEGFELRDTRNVAHSGDYHLTFPDFTVLTDCKNFVKGKVSTTDISKFHYDVLNQANIKIGWLISIRGYIGAYPKRPFVVEVREGKLFVYVNDVKNAESPRKLLEDVYYVSQFLFHNVLHQETTHEELGKYKRYEKQVRDLALHLVKNNKEMTATIMQLRQTMGANERIINDILNQDVLNVRDSHTSVIEQWFYQFLVSQEGVKLKSNALYDHFVQTNEGTDITMDMFKSILKSLVPSDRLQLPKTEKSQYVLHGYQWKSLEGP